MYNSRSSSLPSSIFLSVSHTLSFFLPCFHLSVSLYLFLAFPLYLHLFLSVSPFFLSLYLPLSSCFTLFPSQTRPSLSLSPSPISLSFSPSLILSLTLSLTPSLSLFVSLPLRLSLPSLSVTLILIVPLCAHRWTLTRY